MCAGSCLRAHALWLHAQADSCVHILRISLICFSKIDLFAQKLHFSFNISQVNLTSDWALNQPWPLEFQHHWGTGGQVVRGTECGVYKCLSFDS